MIFIKWSLFSPYPLSSQHHYSGSWWERSEESKTAESRALSQHFRRADRRTSQTARGARNKPSSGRPVRLGLICHNSRACSSSTNRRTQKQPGLKTSFYLYENWHPEQENHMASGLWFWFVPLKTAWGQQPSLLISSANLLLPGSQKTISHNPSFVILLFI